MAPFLNKGLSWHPHHTFGSSVAAQFQLSASKDLSFAHTHDGTRLGVGNGVLAVHRQAVCKWMGKPGFIVAVTNTSPTVRAAASQHQTPHV